MADSTLAALTEDTDPTTTSILYLVEDPAGSPLNRKITAANLLKVINNLTADTSPVIADSVVTYDASASASKKVTLDNFYKTINGLTADSAPDQTADYVATYDASASGAKKVLLQNIGGYSLQFSSAGSTFNPADATTYYLGCFPSEVPTTTAQRRKIRIPRGGVIRRIDLFINCATGTNETSTVSFRLNDTTDTTISSSVALNATPFEANNTSVTITVATGDYFEIKWVTPTWATNPTAVSISGVVWVS